MNRNTRHALGITALLVMVVALAGVGLPGGRQVALAAPAAAPVRAPMLADLLPATTCAPSCDLWAKEGTLLLPDGVTAVPIWGFADTAAGAAQLPGPALIVNQGDSVTVNLTNDIAGETISLSFPGQDLVPDLVGVSTGNTTSYTFTPSEPGTFLYEAGLTANGARQVAMGLFGALIVRPTGQPGWAYDADSAFDDEALLVLSEIDPDFNNDPNGFNLPDFKAEYWLINGKAYPDANAIPTAPGNRVLLRYLNAGVRGRTVGVLGLHQTVLGVDGSQLPFPYQIVAESLGAGQALDALVTIPATASVNDRYAIYDTGLQLHNAGALATSGMADFGGILTFLELAGGAAFPDVGPLASNVAVAPDPATGAADLTLSADLDETTTGGSNIVAWEYFTETLGIDGSGVLMAVAVPATTVSVDTTIPSAQLSTWPTGDVTFYVHGQDELGHWGPVSSTVLDLVKDGPVIRSITLTPPSTNGSVNVALWATADDTPTGNINVMEAEYFVGAAGADGTGTPMALNQNPAPVLGIFADIPTSMLTPLPEGPVTIYIHARDALNNWGGFGTIDLLIDRTGPNAIGLSLVPNPNNGTLGVNSSTNAVRLRAIIGDDLNRSGLERAEGFIDYEGPANDPDGSGFPLISSDALYNSTVEQVYADIPLNTVRLLAQGPHAISFHGKDVAGNWGPMGSLTLIVDKTGPAMSGVAVLPNPTGGASNVSLVATATDSANGAASASNVVAAEWFVGIDPGAGFGTPLTAADGQFSSSSEVVNATINVSGWTNDNHVISVRAKDVAGNWGAVTDVTLTVQGNQAQNVLLNGFETGNLAGWNAAVGNVTVVEAAAMEGTWGMAAQLNGAAPAYVVDRTPMDETEYHASFFFNPNNADTAGSSHDLLVGFNAEGTPIFGIQFEQGASGPEVRAWVRQGGTEAFTDWVHIENVAQKIGISWLSSASATFSLSLNDAVQQTLTGLNTAAYRLEETWLGPSGGLADGMAGTEYFDSFVSLRAMPQQQYQYDYFLPVVNK